MSTSEKELKNPTVQKEKLKPKQVQTQKDNPNSESKFTLLKYTDFYDNYVS